MRPKLVAITRLLGQKAWAAFFWDYHLAEGKQKDKAASEANVDLLRCGSLN